MQTKNNLLRLLVALLTLLPLSVAAQESVKLAEWNMENSADIAVTWFKDGAPQIAPDEAIGDKANYLLTGWSEGRYWQLCTGYQNKVLRIENAAENAITGICSNGDKIVIISDITAIILRTVLGSVTGFGNIFPR